MCATGPRERNFEFCLNGGWVELKPRAVLTGAHGCSRQLSQANLTGKDVQLSPWLYDPTSRFLKPTMFYETSSPTETLSLFPFNLFLKPWIAQRRTLNTTD
jgi:hypothetical protein